MPTHPTWWKERAQVNLDTVSNFTSITNVQEIPAGGSADQVLTKDTGTDYDVSWQTPSGGGGSGITQYVYPIWAEENSTLGNSTYEWAFGNGANTPTNNGIAIYVPVGWQAHIVAMGATTNNASGTSVIEAEINGTLQGSNCNVTLAGRSAVNSAFTPVALSNADRLNFRTTTAGTNTAPNSVVAWIRMQEV